MLFGDPEMRVFEPGPAAERRVLDAQEEGAGRWTLRMPELRGPVECFDVRIPGASPPAGRPMHCAANVGDSDDTLLHAQPGRGAGLELLVASRRQTRGLDVRIDAELPLRRDVQCAAQEFLSNIERSGIDRLVMPSNERSESEDPELAAQELPFGQVGRLLESFESTLVAMSVRPTVAPRVYRELQEVDALLRHACEQQGQALLSLVLAHADTHFLYRLFMMIRGIQWLAVSDAERCRRCGGRIRRYLYQVGVIGVHRRTMFECERCLQVGDVEEDDRLRHLEGPEHIVCGRSHTFTLDFRNDGDQPAFVQAAATVSVMKGNAMPVAQPGPIAPVEPGEERRIQFEVSPGPGALVQVGRVRLLLLVNGRISDTLRPIEVARA